ncbi:MAG: tetratricopeptide repeat protein [Sedimentisphaerales bacterium]|nr:tetratricopeptide repeat protein [Sedimentisphaerales bacterium]
MERHKILTVVVLTAVGVLALVGLQFCLAGQSGGTKPASVLMQEALYAEEIDGDLDAAIKIYEQVIKSSTAQRSHVAQAMYRQGSCYMKQNKEQQAQEIFQKLIAQYSEQTDIISKVKPLLDGLANADPASLMPPETLFYAEIGSPGRQVETILNMLKGTALENPIAALGGNNMPQGAGPPANFIASLLNPGMMAEFKKIQGVGIGITGIPGEDEPPALIVLFPGKSDALKGLLQMALTMAGKPAESIEGMQTVDLEGGCAAYDDNVVILATPKARAAGQFTWSVKQYKGLIKEPTLASSNKSFTKVSRKARQENLLTVWIDTDQFFAGLKKVLPTGELPEAIRMMDSTVNLDSVDDILAFFSLEKTGIAVEANVAFKDGHNSLAYNMFRTPNISKAGLEAVPSGAIGLISLAIGEAGSPQAQFLSQKIKEATKLDIGGEIFSNIEQVILFILPPDSTTAQTNTDIPKIASSIGLAIKSRDPEQTRQILAKLLAAADFLPAESTASPTEPINGRYEIPLVEGLKVLCYMNNDSKTTVLSLSPAVIDSSISAVKNRQSVLAAGPLQEQLSKISPDTCKLILFNIGGIVRTAKANSNAPDEVNQIFDLLASSTDTTCLQLRTDEKTNNLNIRADVIGIPPINELFVPLMQLAQIMEQSQSQWQEQPAQKVPTALIKITSQAPAIDGQVDGIWAQAQKYPIANTIYSAASSPQDLSAYYRVLCDQDNLYLLVDVTDDELKNDSEEFYYDDSIELFIDGDNSKNGSYGENDFTYNFNWDKSNPNMEERGQPYQGDIKSAMVTTDNGYRLEVKIPWAAIGTKSPKEAKIGLDVHVNDDDDGGERETKLTWSDKQDDAWQNPRVFGIAEVPRLVGYWKLDETEGNTISDSSGNNITGTLKEGALLETNAGRSGGAVTFPAPGSCAEISTAGMSAYAGTINLWIKLIGDQTSPEHRYIFGHTTEPHYSNRIQLYMNSGTTMLDVGLGDNHETNTDMTTLEMNKWYNITMSWNDGTYKVYLDGKQLASGSYTGLVNISKTANIGNNGRTDSRDQSFNGLIDDVRIYNYALSEDEIKAIGN